MTTDNFIGYKRSSRGGDSFFAAAAATGEHLPEKFTWATAGELEETVVLAASAFRAYQEVSLISRALFLEAIAAELTADAAAIMDRFVLETGLTIDRARNELTRTSNQLLLFAQMLREGDWLNVRIYTADLDDKHTSKPDLRTVLVPVGPVVVFGASNFPLAFSTIGGDTVSALAAGCPVIVKAHPLHPGTNALVSVAVIRAALSQRMPEGVFSSLHLTNEMAVQLVMYPQIAAVGFTGSRKTGLQLCAAAAKRNCPIPVFAEMSSVNPVILLPWAMQANGKQIAAGLADSISLGAGQFCTNPGLLVVLDTADTQHFINRLITAIDNKPAQPMLSVPILQSFLANIKRLMTSDGVTQLNCPDAYTQMGVSGNRVVPVLFEVTAPAFLADRQLQEEVFGPATMIVRCASFGEVKTVLNSLDGQLTATLHASPLDDIIEQTFIINILRSKAGRLVFNGFPTGVEVCDAMQHGGPFPSTSDSRFTSVGTAAVYRFVRPVAFQGFPDHLLPSALRRDNPDHIPRKVNGRFTVEKL